jgi:hypothetical protein
MAMLLKNEIKVLPAASGYVIHVECGCIWLTRSKDRHDYILKRSDKIILDKHESAVIEALKDSCLTIKTFKRMCC